MQRDSTEESHLCLRRSWSLHETADRRWCDCEVKLVIFANVRKYLNTISGSELVTSIKIDETGEITKLQTANSSDNAVCSLSTSKQEHDVTGGIELKIECAKRIVRQSQGCVPVHICGLISRAFESLATNVLNNDLYTTITMDKTLTECIQ